MNIINTSTSCAACSAAATVYMPPPPASGDLNIDPELSGCRSLRMSVMRVIVLHPCIPSLKFLGLPLQKIWLILGHDLDL